jgi:hypothetical protein
MYRMAEKFAKLGKQDANPFSDPEGYKTELDTEEGVFRAELEGSREPRSDNSRLHPT